MKSKIISLRVLLPCFLFSQDSTDTLWSVPQLDGTICYRPGSGIFNMSTSSSQFIPGDAFDVFLGEEVFCRDYLGFDLSQLSNSDTSAILSAFIGIYQFASFGNEQLNVYPIWNVAGGDTHFCVLDHIDYGSNLDLGDWTAGDPGDLQTLKTNIGIISDNAVIEYKTMDVTRYVKEDIVAGRNYNQYRMRFTINTDFDHLADGLEFSSGNSILNDKPYLVISYYDTTAIIESQNLPLSFHLGQNYPNPFNPGTTISYIIQTSGKVDLTVFNVLGGKVQTLVDIWQPAGSYVIQFDGFQLPSGIYWYRLTFNGQANTQKMLLIH